MISVDEKLIDTMTATFHSLRTGGVPPPIAIPDDLPNNEIRQLLVYINRFLVEFSPFAETMKQVSQGNLNSGSLLSRMAVVDSLKMLQSNLKHLTWKTQQIAAGDLEQKVDFMGDFSKAFNTMTQQLKDSYEALERRNRFIRKTFGRYTSDEIVEALLDIPEGLELGGEKREITILMSDLRGFTALAERLEATEVVPMLNHYLSAMVELIQKNGGTIDEIIGDAILVLFGAPVKTEDAAQRAVRCALEMQMAMDQVNAYNLEKGWPELEMGIALHTGEVVVGNIGSTKRTKYGVVGRTVNLTARIESFIIGGQILVSPSLINACQTGLILGTEIKVHAKGMREALACRELLGLSDHPELSRRTEIEACRVLDTPLPCFYLCLTEKHLDEQMKPAVIVSLSSRRAEIEINEKLPLYSNLLLKFEVNLNKESPELYAKSLHSVAGKENRYLIHFTSVSPDMRSWLKQYYIGSK